MIEYKPKRSLFDIVCLSSAAGLLLYWAMFLNVLPRLMRPYASTAFPFMSAVIGFISCALSYIGVTGLIASARSKPKAKQSLVMRRGEGGGVVSINLAKAEYVTKTGAAKANVIQPIQKAQEPLKHGKAKQMIGVAVSIALVIGSQASLMIIMGYTGQDIMSGMYSPLMVVSSQSMQPILNYGDLIIVRKEPADRIAVGDVIAFNVPSPYTAVSQSPTVHEVVEKLNENGVIYFKTKGENNPGLDQWNIPAENVIGKYAGKVPYIGLVAVFLKGPLGLAMIAALIALCIIYPYFKNKLKGGATP
jgi:signal peptidase I